MKSIPVDELITMAKRHNEAIDEYMNVTLKEHFGGDKITLAQWFEAQQMIREQNFFEKAREILKPLRAAGIDCKMDAQSNKLHCPKYDITAY